MEVDSETISTAPDHGWSPTALAQATGWHKGTVSNALCGRKGMTMAKAAELAKAAGVTLDVLYARINTTKAAVRL